MSSSAGNPGKRTARAAEFFGIALALAIVEAGWPLHLQPDEHYVLVDNERVSAKELMQQLLSKETTHEAWIERCRSLKIVGVRLAVAPPLCFLAIFTV